MAKMPLDSKTTVPPQISTAAQIVVLVAVALAIGAGEWARWNDPESRTTAMTGWLCGVNADWLPYVPWLILAPVFWNVGRRRVAPEGMSVEGGGIPAPSPATWSTWVWAIGSGMLSLMVSVLVASRFGDVPPAYHDEFSYLFQAKTFLAGRLWFPSFEPMPQLFDQMHVLNEGHFASRYFPGAGAWLAPFVALGNAWSGEWIAAAVAAFCTFWIGREVGGEFAGRVAGVLAALSPGLALFSNLLLAHHPTLMGLTFFIGMYLLARRTGRIRYACCAGIGLTFAMLCRPMTALGIGLPFGIHFAWWLLRGGDAFPVGRTAASLRYRTALAAAMAGPLVIGFVILLGYNRAITGDPLVSPYQLYTDIYTPRHVYGFNNVTRGEQRLGPKVLENYDRWAENLTPRLAARNVGRRLMTSLRWTLGIVPLVAAALVLALSRGVRNVPCRLIGAAILALHGVHVPYWFEGIMGWHYVFESAPLWLVLFAEATRRLCQTWQVTGRPAMGWWWGGVAATAVLVNLVTAPSVWPGRLERGMAEVAFSRDRYAAFQQQAAQMAGGRRAIIFVEPDPSDRHIDYVVNDPGLDGAMLIARYEPGKTELSAARALFADRAAFLYRAADQSWESLPDVESGPDP
jgi:hypothetical protein